MRHRRNKQADLEHKQEASSFAAAAAAAAGPRIPATRKASGPDSRIDPDAMAQHRLSDGSIADNEDYSRRILKVRLDQGYMLLERHTTNNRQVTNPDDR